MAKLILFLMIITAGFIFPQDQPKREMRGVWIATVANIDWPSAPGLSTEQQKKELISLMEQLKLSGINAVYFQIRTECDALYNSSYEPWSYWLTGTQGLAPSPYYDPLEFAVEEAHKRGMELHAWFNPYRAVKADTGRNSYAASPLHISVTNPSWVLKMGNYKFLDPGLPEVNEYIVKIFMDVLNRYDVDGIHMDDYFYPYPDPEPLASQDSLTFMTHNRGITDLHDWRRDNINLLIKELSRSISAAKPWVKWGVSPFGIWRPGYPAGIKGFDAYASIYCDPVEWLQEKTVDYIVPQIYWPFGGGQDYGKLLPWWADSTSANGRHLYIGQASFRIERWSAEEMPAQIRLNRSNPNCQGSIYFNAKDFFKNPKGFVDSLRNNYYATPAVPDLMTWKENIPPNAPANLRIGIDELTGEFVLRWDAPSPASDGDAARRYAVYRFSEPPVSCDLDNGKNLFGLTGITTLPGKYANLKSGSGNYFVVTALDKNNNESEMSNILETQTLPGDKAEVNPTR